VLLGRSEMRRVGRSVRKMSSVWVRTVLGISSLVRSVSVLARVGRVPFNRGSSTAGSSRVDGAGRGGNGSGGSSVLEQAHRTHSSKDRRSRLELHSSVLSRFFVTRVVRFGRNGPGRSGRSQQSTMCMQIQSVRLDMIGRRMIVRPTHLVRVNRWLLGGHLLRVRLLQGQVMLLLQTSELLMQVLVQGIRVSAWPAITLAAVQFGQIF